MNIDYKQKYLKYKNKYNKISKNQKGAAWFNGSQYANVFEGSNDNLNNTGIEGIGQTYEEERREFNDYGNNINEDPSYRVQIPDNKFFISSHGAQLTNGNLCRIRVPENFHIFFQADTNQVCNTYDYHQNILPICNNSQELYSEYLMANYNPNVANSLENRKWLNYHGPGDIIYDCLLSGDATVEGKVYYCSLTLNNQIITFGARPTLLSILIIQILHYIRHESLELPIYLFCTFCLNNDETLYGDVFQTQGQIYNSMYQQLLVPPNPGNQVQVSPPSIEPILHN